MSAARKVAKKVELVRRPNPKATVFERALARAEPLLKLALIGDPEEVGELRLRLQIGDGDVAWLGESKSLLLFLDEASRRMRASKAARDARAEARQAAHRGGKP